ncbi:homoserine dehydrogenase [Clostridium sp. USBA 49]|jgi:homoserine dehydrogenase|uniref:homoserine dehydrogenase n=1 Tax=Clostridium sp. USBA 49 TaxID=1881060 RepID=UPI00099AC4F4|nr:homoserine dehydrogenase [Clostridium sp. USBA 49]SKA73923.1 homoserine dehydrogenase [Clostridium sp. USBA 49]
MESVKIALLGLGNVGKGVWNILNMNNEEIIKRAGCKIEIAKVLVKDKNKDRGINIPKEILTTDIDDILNDDDIKIVVEVMGGIEPAREYILNSINKRKHIVTANKLLIATHGEEIFKKAEEKEVIVNFEASVAGGIPIINVIKESLTGNKIKEIIGIINGTTNYILTKMTSEKMDFQDALKKAQEKGYAEADPTSDIEGFDAAYKLAILTKLAYETNVDINKVYREGITKISSVDVEYAREFGYVIKLLGIAKNVDENLELRVHLTMIPSNHPLANVNNSYNAILLKGNAVGNLMLYGKGAGELPTGSAVVGDIISTLRNNRFNNTYTYNIEKNVVDIKEVSSEYYLRITVKDDPGVLGQISTILGEEGVSISSFIQKSKVVDEGYVYIVIFTHQTLEEKLNNALNKIKDLKVVKQIDNVIRVENLD